MKYALLTVLFAVTLADRLYAQVAGISMPEQFGAAYSKTTGTAERVIASAGYANFGTTSLWPVDSGRYTWSGTRTSKNGLSKFPVVNMEDYDTYTQMVNRVGIGGVAVPAYRTLKTYNTDGKKITEIFQDWDAAGLLWINRRKTTYSYSGKELLEVLEQSWDGIMWQNNTRKVHTYIAGNRAESYTDYWSASISGWRRSIRTLYTYSGTYLIEESTAEWDNYIADWYNDYRSTYDYTGGLITHSTYYNWNYSASKWAATDQYGKEYIGGLIAADSHLVFNERYNIWETTQRTELDYTAGRIIRYTNYSLKGPEKKMTPGIKYDYHYTGAQNDTILSSSWNDTTASWDINYKSSFTYNSNNSLIIAAVHRAEDDKWQAISKVLYYYEDYIPAGIPDSHKRIRDIRIYPNPALSVYVYIDYNTTDATTTDIVLKDIYGRWIHGVTEAGSIGDHSVMIPLDGLAQGVYIISLFSNGQLQQSARLVK